MTWNGVEDGKPVPSGQNEDLTGVDISGSYAVKIPSPGLAVVMFEKELLAGEPSGGGNSSSSPSTGSNSTGSTNTNTTGDASNGGSGSGSNNSSALSVDVPIVAALGAVFVGVLVLN